MDTTRMTREGVSALADGESSDSQIDELLAELRDPAIRADWDIYHQIGDILRSEESSIPFSADFADRLAKRLDAEPVIVAPVLQVAIQRRSGALGRLTSLRRFAMPGVVAAAAAAAAFVGAPHLMVALNTQGTGSAVAESSASMVASASHTVSHASVIATSATSGAAAINTQADGGRVVILRDPAIDEYLIAHQRFSPSVNSTAQFARSAAFANESSR